MQRPGVALEREGQLVGIEQLAAFTEGAVAVAAAVLAVAEQGTADGRHVGADLVGAAGEQRALDERQLLCRGERAVDGFRGLGARNRTVVERDLLALFIAAQEVFDAAARRLGSAEHHADVFLFQLVLLDLVVQDAQRLGGFRGDDDAAGVAVNAVAERRSERSRVLRVPRARLIEIRLNVGDERVGVALFVRVHDHARRLVCEQDILVLVDDGEARRLDAAERLFLAHGFEVFVVDVELEQVALGELARGLGALAVELDALEAQVLVHHAA